MLSQVVLVYNTVTKAKTCFPTLQVQLFNFLFMCESDT